ncbi:acetyltransferase YpeA [mine drainage metagenome]|uniref:Acetyltransferase YpeA n=1 Tax=mine drainage metagenome TaxID=410659 RepID=A0A1J5QYQ7_9ZZZZ
MSGGVALIRPARPEESGIIVSLVRRLAAFERAAAPPALTEAVVRRDCFGPNPRFQVLLAETAGRVCGGVVLLDGYSSWAGAPTLTVHDLYVEEGGRGQGAGRALLAAAAAQAQARGCVRLDVNVLDWNHAARAFYERAGFTPLSGWLPYRLQGEALARLAEEG